MICMMIYFHTHDCDMCMCQYALKVGTTTSNTPVHTRPGTIGM